MDFATIQAQLAKLIAQLSQYAERTTMQSVPTCGVSYGQGYPTHQCSQFTANEDAWGYQSHSQSWDNMFSNADNSDWRDYSHQILAPLPGISNFANPPLFLFHVFCFSY
ncbi:hypothetical protein FF1_006896 [Malus domestica]